MTDEELIARLRDAPADGLGTENLCLAAADRIEALRAELEAYRNSHLHADKLLLQEKARVKRLEAALRSIIGWLEDPKGGSHEEDMREASRIARAALKGDDHE